MLIGETRNNVEVWFGKVMENSCFKHTDRQENNTETDLGKDNEIKCSILKCLKIMSSGRLLVPMALKCEFLPGKLDSYKRAMKLVLGYECGHYLHFLQQYNHVILAQVSLSNLPLAVAAHRQK